MELIDVNGKIEDVKVGTRVVFYEDNEIDFGVVTKISNDKYLVKWDSDGMCLSVRSHEFNSIWGIESSKENRRHKHYDVILHWASGGKIQYLDYTTEWKDYMFELDHAQSVPAFNSYLGWRIKPNVRKIRCRMAMLKNKKIVVMYDEPTLEDAYGDDCFLRWIDPEWKEISIED